MSGGTSPVVLIDGRSGAGKSSFARVLAGVWEADLGVRPQLIGMDELYPGWDGLAAGSASLAQVLRSATYRSYDWFRGEFGDELRLDRERPLIVEGCGSLSAASLAAAREWGETRTLWIECPAELRKSRALARDGDMFAPHWERWAEQERELFARTQPVALAREIVHAA